MRISSLALTVPALTLLAGVAAADPPDAATLAKADVCTDGKGHYVVIAPNPDSMTELHYGDGKTFHAVPPPPNRTVGGDWFEEPRYYNPQYNESFRGLDLRGYSHVDIAADKTMCAVACGTRTTKLTVMPADKAQALLAAATFGPPLRKWTPYALARDQLGKYYYVDRGFAPGEEKNFRLFVGPKGSLKLQKMTNIVSDSEGDVFSTKTGSLRMILGKGESVWIEGEKQQKLLPVPVEANLKLIFTDFGVYAGEKLGTPCDDL